MTVAQALAAAVASHQAGDFARAEQIYRQVLAVDPHNADALHLLGLALYQSGQAGVAVDYVRQAIRLKPDFAQAHYNLGNMLRELSQPAEAVASYQQALRFQPGSAETWYNLGNALQELKQFAPAVDAYRQAIQLKPNYIKALNNLGNAYLDRRQPAEAAACYRQILASQPAYAKGYCNLGHALRELGELEESIRQCQRSIELDPENPEAHNNLGAALMDLGRTDDALAAFARALEIRPDYAEAHMNRAMTWLVMGDYVRGWPEYEWRWRSKAFTPRGFQQGLWDGAPLSNPARPDAPQTILLDAEQGLGDTLHFVRYTPHVKARGGRVILECPAALHKLLSAVPGIDQFVATGSPLPPFDVHAPLLSLPGLLFDAAVWHRAGSGDRTDAFASEPYLRADPALVEQWRQQLAALDGFKVGINWQGNPQHPKDRQRSMALAHFVTLAKIGGVRLVSLQKGFGVEQLESLPAEVQIDDLGSRLDVTSGAFMDTAAVLMSLDLVITSDTALAHLAGALGVPVWVALSTTPDWRWLLHGDTTPWYPTMRLFRQRTAGDWGEVFEQIAGELRAMADGGCSIGG